MFLHAYNTFYLLMFLKIFEISWFFHDFRPNFLVFDACWYLHGIEIENLDKRILLNIVIHSIMISQ